MEYRNNNNKIDVKGRAENKFQTISFYPQNKIVNKEIFSSFLKENIRNRENAVFL